MATLFAQPYDISATGFYFETIEQYAERAAKVVNDYGEPVEEFEIQFIDGEALDAALPKAWQINQANIAAHLEAVGGLGIPQQSALHHRHGAGNPI